MTAKKAAKGQGAPTLPAGANPPEEGAETPTTATETTTTTTATATTSPEVKPGTLEAAVTAKPPTERTIRINSAEQMVLNGLKQLEEDEKTLESELEAVREAKNRMAKMLGVTATTNGGTPPKRGGGRPPRAVRPEGSPSPAIRGRRAGEKTIAQYVWEVLKEAGPGGLTQGDLVAAVVAAGFQSDSENEEQAAKSIYVSGTNKLSRAGYLIRNPDDNKKWRLSADQLKAKEFVPPTKE